MVIGGCPKLQRWLAGPWNNWLEFHRWRGVGSQAAAVVGAGSGAETTMSWTCLEGDGGGSQQRCVVT